MTWTNRLDLSAVRALVGNPTGGVAKDMLRRGLKVETQAKRNLGGVDGPKRVDTGRLRASINTHLVKTSSGAYMAVVGTNVWYARLVHDGTGVWGPRHRLIRPKVKKVLKFIPKGQGHYVYAKYSKGMVRNRFLTNALPAARD